jgi:orotidine-5'-phosphate decarboxylase
MTVFADRLIESQRRLGHPLCVGLDPFAARIPALFGPAGEPATAERFFTAVLEAVAGKVAIVKPQIGLFEPWGAEGVAVVQRLFAAARDLGLLVLLDAKRGDIGTTAEGYAAATLGPGSAFGADCVTINPYLGLDSLEPFALRASSTGTGMAVLVRTSNPGAGDFQDLDCGGAPLWQRVAEALVPLQDRLMGMAGWSSLMVVAGATWPGEAARLRQVLPRTLFLVPGYGAQGGAARDAVAGFVPGHGGRLEGGAVSSSRAILYPAGADVAASMADWRAIIEAALDQAVAELTAATASGAAA